MNKLWGLPFSPPPSPVPLNHPSPLQTAQLRPANVYYLQIWNSNVRDYKHKLKESSFIIIINIIIIIVIIIIIIIIYLIIIINIIIIVIIFLYLERLGSPPPGNYYFIFISIFFSWTPGLPTPQGISLANQLKKFKIS